MKRVVGPAGYTIVETMIFLAVSALLFISASVLITGRQRKTQFETTVRDFSTKIQSVSGNVASGYYNSTGGITCTVAGGNTIDTLAPGSNEQGTSGRCMYLGQVLVSPTGTSSDFQVVSLVGLRATGSPAKEVDTLFKANPRLYTATAETYKISGAEVAYVKAGNTLVGNTTDGSAVAFLGSLGSYNGDILKTGSGHTDIYTVGSSQTTTGGAIESGIKNATTPTTEDINYCLTNGEQYALITLRGGVTSYKLGDSGVCP